jgi:hypothetical protein
MAESHAHKWGQTIGNVFQLSLREVFQKVAAKHGLYLDYQKERPARGKNLKVCWEDRFGNSHDLDYVMERGGTEQVKGVPAAFIEVAWRRYTKHSKNKAQEIEGAVLALADTYSHVRPFLGIVLAGAWTAKALAQLRSRQFTVAYISYEDIVGAFKLVGIDASSTEDTPEDVFQEKVRAYQALSPRQLDTLKKALLFPKQGKGEGPSEPVTSPMEEFVGSLNASLARGVVGFTVTVLHGRPHQLATAADVVAYLEGYKDNKSCSAPAAKFEIDVRYNNGDIIHGIFQEKGAAIAFARTFV